jgi:transketolase
LSRQKLPVMNHTAYGSSAGLSQGAYVLVDSAGKPDIILIASGSEVHIALEAANLLMQEGVSVRVVSMPSWELFEKTPQEYRNQVLPPGVSARIAVEAGLPMGWERYVGSGGSVVGMTTFGASAPGETLMEKFGFNAESIVRKALEMLKR